MFNIDKNLKKLNLTIISKIDKSEIKYYTKVALMDNEGYKYYLDNGNLSVCIRRKGILARYYNNNPFTEDNIRLYIKQNCGDNIEIVSCIGSNAKEKFKLYCNIHNQEFEHSWNNLKNGQYCPICGRENSSGNGLKHNIEKVKKLAISYGISIVDNNYINNETPLAFICNKHKDKGIQYKSWGNIITSTHSCNYCASESIIKTNSITHDEFLIQFKDCFNFTKLNIIGRYIGCREKIEVECKKCGHKFLLRADHILRGIGCPECRIKSLGEEIIKHFLKKKNINHIREYRFDDCKNTKALPFDFYLPDYNCCIEFDGKQHFEPNDFSGKNDKELAMENFKTIQYHDEIKNKYCIDNNIKLIRIPYWEIKNIKNILIKELELN